MPKKYILKKREVTAGDRGFKRGRWETMYSYDTMERAAWARQFSKGTLEQRIPHPYRWDIEWNCPVCNSPRHAPLFQKGIVLYEWAVFHGGTRVDAGAQITRRN